jgi:hypothetical protein
MGLRDLVVLHSLQHQGISLCPEAGLAPNRSPLWEIITSTLSLSGAPILTYVASEPLATRSRRGFIQLRLLRGRPAAELLYIAPGPSRDGVPLVWDRLLDRVAAWVSAQGVARVLAGLPADGPAEEAFRRNGYIRYATETIYGLETVSVSTARLSGRLRPLLPQRDVWSMQRLYSAITPLRVQQAEGLLHAGWHVLPDEWSSHGWTLNLVAEDHTGFRGELSLRRGGDAHWMRISLRPDSLGLASELVDDALARVARWPDRPLYCAVRHYQDLLASVLIRRGFTPVMERALTVRPTVLCVRPALEEAILRIQGALGTGLNSAVNESHSRAARRRLASARATAAPEWSNDRS